MIKSNPQKIIEWKKRTQRNALKRYRKGKPIFDKVLKRDGYRCKRVKDNEGYCNSVFRISPHHIKPRSAGGKDTPKNLITLCLICHDIHHTTEGKRERTKQFKEYIKTIYVKPKNQSGGSKCH